MTDETPMANPPPENPPEKNGAIPLLSYETEQIAQRLLKVPRGEFVSYEELSKAAGIEVHGGTPQFQSARRILLSGSRGERMVFRPPMRSTGNYGKGVVHLDDEMTVTIGDEAVQHMRRAARKGRKELSCIRDYTALPNDKQLRLTARRSLLGLVSVITRPAAQPKLLASVQGRLEISPRDAAKALLARANVENGNGTGENEPDPDE